MEAQRAMTRKMTEFLSDQNSPFCETHFEKSARIRSEKNKIVRYFYLMVTSVAFNLTIMLLIIANTIFMAIYSNNGD